MTADDQAFLKDLKADADELCLGIQSNARIPQLIRDMAEKLIRRAVRFIEIEVTNESADG